MPPNERERTAVVERTSAAAQADVRAGLTELARQAAATCRTRFAGVSLVTREHVEFVAMFGAEPTRFARDAFFCAEAILGDDLFIVGDATTNPRYRRCSSGPLGIRFYAGVRLSAPSGEAIGALSVFDTEPRRGLVRADAELLRSLAGAAEAVLAGGDVTYSARAGDATRRRHELETGDEREAEGSNTPRGLPTTALPPPTPFGSRNVPQRFGIEDPAPFRRYAETSASVIYATDAHGHVVFVNPAGEQFFGRQSSDLLGLTDSSLGSALDDDDTDGGFVRVSTAVHDLSDDEVLEEQFFDGERMRWFRTERKAVRTTNNPDLYVHTLTDITAQKSAELRHRELSAIATRARQRNEFETVVRRITEFVEREVHASLCCIWLKGGAGWRPVYTRSWPDALAERAFRGSSSPMQALEIPAGAAAAAGRDGAGDSQVLYDGPVGDSPGAARYGGGVRDIGLTGMLSLAVRDADGELLAALDVLSPRALSVNSSERVACAEAAHVLGIAMDLRTNDLALRRQTQLDGVTRLLNRAALEVRINQELQRRSTDACALLHIDIDRFSKINELGIEFGDALLREVAGRLERIVRQTDSLARLGNDEFGILLTDVGDTSGAIRVAQAILADLRQPLQVMTRIFPITVSIGIAMFPGDADDASTLMRNAAAALNRARDDRSNQSKFRFFAPEIHANAVDRVALETDLRQAIMDSRLEMHLQPQYRIDTGRLCGFEALARWFHPERGSVAPDMFIPLAEDMRLIHDVGVWMLRETGRFAREWLDVRRVSVTVSVNVSPVQLAQPDFVDQIAETVSLFRIPPGMLEIELTESAVISDLISAVEKLEQVRRLGVRVAVDDFGTGHSNLALLNRLPFDRIKLDRSFIKGLRDATFDTRLVVGIIQLARALDLEVIAEGVESEAQLRFLRGQQCHIAQGWGFHKAMAPSEALRLEELGRLRDYRAPELC